MKEYKLYRIINLINRSRKHDNSSSKYNGVHKHRNKFIVGIQNKNIIIKKTFSDELEAARFYDEKAIELHGDKAKLNFPIVNYIKN